MKKLVIDCATNQEAYVDLSPEEIEVIDQRKAEEAAELEALAAEQEARNLLIQSAREKMLNGEPLTEEEADLLLNI